MLDRAALAGGAPGGEHVVGNGELLGFEPELLARCLDLVLAERRTVGRRRALLVGRAKADDRPAADQARPRIGDRFLDRAAHVAGVEPVAFAGMPLRRLMAGDHVLVARQIGRAVDGDACCRPTGRSGGRA